MEAARAQQFRQKTLANWTDPQTVAAWRRWHGLISRQQKAVSDALVEAACIAPGMRVLDLASGSGEPALQIAALVGSNGHVVATDVSAEMLALARENALAQGIENVSFQVADCESLPFEDASFDAATCRKGVMFFVGIAGALREIRRVLRPGGTFASSAWGPLEQNQMFGVFLNPILRYCRPPSPPPGAPQPMRFAKSGTLSSELTAAGFTNVVEALRIFPAPFYGTPEEDYQSFCDLVSPPYFDELPEAERAPIAAEIMKALGELHRDGAVRTDSAVVIASASG